MSFVLEAFTYYVITFPPFLEPPSPNNNFRSEFPTHPSLLPLLQFRFSHHISANGVETMSPGTDTVQNQHNNNNGVTWRPHKHRKKIDNKFFFNQFDWKHYYHTLWDEVLLRKRRYKGWPIASFFVPDRLDPVCLLVCRRFLGNWSRINRELCETKWKQGAI